MRLFTPLLLAALVVPASSLHAQTAADPSGHWEGTVEIPGNPSNFQLDLAKTSTGELAGAITVADVTRLPLAKVAVDGASVTFYARSDQPFRGVLSDDGKLVSGTYAVSGYSLSFGMSRTGDARIEPPVTSHSVSKELEGTWNGTLRVNGTALRLVLTVTNQPGGLAIGRIVSLDEGGLIVPVVIMQKASSVSYEQTGVVGSYSGTLSPEGTELEGTWTQKSLSLPLTFQRATK